MAGTVSKMLERAGWQRVTVKKRGMFKQVNWSDKVTGAVYPQYFAHQVQVNRNKIAREQAARERVGING